MYGSIEEEVNNVWVILKKKLKNRLKILRGNFKADPVVAVWFVSKGYIWFHLTVLNDF